MIANGKTSALTVIEINDKKSSKKKKIILSIIAVILIAVITVGGLVLFNRDKETISQENDTQTDEPVAEYIPVIYYDNLTGKEIVRSGKQSDGSTLSEDEAKKKAEEINSEPIFCIQTPNGMDGARPQISLNDASIIYEAIAEAGITRFAAIYKNPDNSVIGPVRSLRNYYLDWDIPYDCIIVHAGGEEEANKRVQSYRHLSESRTYMWRDYSGYRAPNNLFTSGSLLAEFAKDNNYTSSNPKTFARLTPDQSSAELVEIKKDKQALENQEKADIEADEKTYEAKYTHAEDIYVRFTSAPNFNVKYQYNSETNSYDRAYEGTSGDHMIYNCSSEITKVGDKIAPKTDCGDAVQMSPSVVAVMKVAEQLSPVNHYREVITTTGSGDAVIFQNGVAIEGTWEKSSLESQIIWKDKSGNIIKLAPGQTIVEAIAKSYGKVEYE